jgi:SAM-dependent methyltransferase
VPTSGFANMEEYVNFLIHSKAYEEAAGMGRGKSVLDWGCNNGYGMEVMGNLGCLVSGIDLNPQAIESARKRLGPTAELILFDGRTAPLPEGRFDVITSFQCIEHVANHDQYLSEIRRVLKPGGIAIFTTPNATIRLDPGMKPWNQFHVREFRPSELRELLAGYFSSVAIRGLFGIPELQRVEIDRCDRARRKVRRQQATGMAASLRRTARRLTPQAVLDLRKPKPGSKPVSLPEHSTADFFYNESSLDSCLDIMAVCRK